MSKNKSLVKPIKIVFLGSVPKGDAERKNSIDWRIEFTDKITKAVPQARFLHNHLLSDAVGPALVVGHDLWLIKHADVVVVNATEKVGAGTAQEIVIAKKFKKPVVSIIPKDTHHRRSNIRFDGALVKDWIHPFLFVGSDAIVENIEQAAAWIRRNAKLKSKRAGKDIQIYEQVVKDFEKKLPKIHREYVSQGW